MSPAVELVLGVIGGTAALATVGSMMVRALTWALTRLIREEVNPSIAQLTGEFAAMRASFEEAQRTQSRGNEELHDAVRAIRETLDAYNERIAAVELSTERLEERTAHLNLGRST